MHKTITIVGYACGLISEDPLCCSAPFLFKGSPAYPLLQSKSQHEWVWIDTLSPRTPSLDMKIMNPIIEISDRLTKHILQIVQKQKPFTVISSDNSSVIGTWLGVAHALNAPWGLILVTPDIKIDQAQPDPFYHATGVLPACFFDYQNLIPEPLQDVLQLPKPEHIVVIGPDKQPKAPFKVYTMDHIQEQGIAPVMAEAYQYLTRQVEHVGFSIALDATRTPGVDIQNRKGISARGLYQALKPLSTHNDAILGIEVTGYNPYRDTSMVTARTITHILYHLMG